MEIHPEFQSLNFPKSTGDFGGKKKVEHFPKNWMPQPSLRFLPGQEICNKWDEASASREFIHSVLVEENRKSEPLKILGNDT